MDNKENFKHLLEYFVAHLEYVNGSSNPQGKNMYIDPLLQNDFKRTGCGYDNDAIQEQISSWDKYDGRRIGITIQANFGNYISKKCYLNWVGTGINIFAEWKENKVNSLYIGHCYWWLKNQAERYSDKLLEKKTTELGLFNNDSVSTDLNAFYDCFKNEIIDYDNKKGVYYMREKEDNKEDDSEEEGSSGEMIQYKKFLNSNYNLILTGAPGTGKTYLAKQIAQQLIFGEVKKEMTDEEKKQFNEQCGFVQFHPSYDYTDFVEGLRPKQDVKSGSNIVFERKDGVFKEFCKKAIGGRTHKTIDEKVSDGEVQNVYSKYANIDNSDFGRIYNSIWEDVSRGKLNGVKYSNSYYSLKISTRGLLNIADGNKTINYETLKYLYNRLEENNWKNLDESRDYYFGLMKEWKDNTTETIDYAYYRAILQEMKNRKEGDISGNIVATSEHTLSSNPGNSDSAVDASAHTKEDDIDEAIKSFKDFVKESGEKGVTIKYLKNSGDFTVIMGDNDSLRVKIANGNTHHTSPEKIKRYIKTKESDDDTYDSSIGQYIIDHYLNKPFVFIIDEINRGEISKIFGELFFSIDPGYRGTDGKVKTQYQNLIEEDDEFFDGFYVPENVYIIGTMNDIDRSVESMDFAFRRRFAFKEVTAEDSQEMLDNENAWKDSNGNSLKPDDKTIELIKGKMESLNKMIWHEEKENEKEEDKCIEGLSSAYHIGASYFLKLKNYDGDFNQLWEYHLEGLLHEYLRGMQGVEDSMKKLKNAYDNANPSNGQ